MFGIFFVSPEDKQSGMYVSNLTLSVVDETNSQENVRDHANIALKKAAKDWENLIIKKLEDIEMLGLPAVRAEYSFTSKDKNSGATRSTWVLQYWIIKDGFAYSMAYMGDSTKYEANVPIIEHMIKTFRITSTPNFGVKS